MVVASTRSGSQTVGVSTVDTGSCAFQRVAFYGRTNRTDAAGLRDLGRQFIACQRVGEGNAVFTRYFYDLPAPIDDLLELAVHGASGPPERHGGWAELATSLSTRGCGFDAIVCADFELLSCRWLVLGIHREEHAAAHGVPILYADRPWSRVRIAMSETSRFLNAVAAMVADRHYISTPSRGTVDGE